MRRSEIVFFIALAIITISVIGAFSMWLATTGHPNSLWFWRDIMGVLSQI